MKLLEHKAHEIFQEYDLPSSKGYIAESIEDLEYLKGKLEYPVVLKAQVETGGRGKAGGIKFAQNFEELIEKGKAILGMQIKELTVQTVFIVPKVDAKKEMYLSFTLDRKNKLPLMIFSLEGGVEINEIAEKSPDTLAKIILPAGNELSDFTLQYAIDKTGLSKEYTEQFKQVCRKLYRVFIEHDCMLAEINPLVIDVNDLIIALDGKLIIDDNALYRHRAVKEFRDKITSNELIKKARKYDFLYIPIQDNGNIAVISNGSGMIMSSIDLISKKGMEVTCAMDLGGGATADRIKEALQIVAENPRVEIIFINIFGGITRCDEIAGGVNNAMEFISNKSLVLRLEGTNKERGLQMIRDLGGDIELVDGLYEGVYVLAERFGR